MSKGKLNLSLGADVMNMRMHMIDCFMGVNDDNRSILNFAEHLANLTPNQKRINSTLNRSIATILSRYPEMHTQFDEGLRKLDSKDNQIVMNEGITVTLLCHRKNLYAGIVCPKELFSLILHIIKLANSLFNKSIPSVHVHSGVDKIARSEKRTASDRSSVTSFLPPVMTLGGKAGSMRIPIDSLITSDLGGELVNTVVNDGPTKHDHHVLPNKSDIQLLTVQLTGTSIVTTSQFSAWVHREDENTVPTSSFIDSISVIIPLIIISTSYEEELRFETAAKIALAVAKMRVLEDAIRNELMNKYSPRTTLRVDVSAAFVNIAEGGLRDLMTILVPLLKEALRMIPVILKMMEACCLAGPADQDQEKDKKELSNQLKREEKRNLNTFIARKRLLAFFVTSLALEAHLPQLDIRINSVSCGIAKSGHSAKTSKTLITANLSDVCASVVIRPNNIGLMVETGSMLTGVRIAPVLSLLQVIQDEDPFLTATADSNPSLLLSLAMFMPRGYTDPATKECGWTTPV
ncbi:hypothetical protein BLNAU_15237 [Blattamonas nauphoetae]|uniref:Uncharacterized protein n=1 Tax=Blattamonas nauphoetae TaxID=2049346 RepID=A0ABQ9XGT1_9EUKA|nr:hypothetical protein BLNAU_15237 [Blattamonas nauphoetae]